VSAISVLYLAETFLYALPVWFFSSLLWTHYELVKTFHGTPIDPFNRSMGVPLMWHVETPNGEPPKVPSGLSRLILVLYGLSRRGSLDRIQRITK
jgi:hypothetical protein